MLIPKFDRKTNNAIAIHQHSNSIKLNIYIHIDTHIDIDEQIDSTCTYRTTVKKKFKY